MKGIESVMRGYAEGGNVNPFQAYAGSPTYSPFDYLGMAAEYAPRPPVQIRTPGTANPLAPAAGGYQDVYGNLEAIKAAQAAKRAADAAAKVVPEAPAGQGTSAGDSGGGGNTGAPTEAAPSSGYNPPAVQGYDTLGKVAGVVGLATGLPLGPAATALSTMAAQDALRSYGIKDELSMKDALLSGLSFGLLGKSIDKQSMDILNQPQNLSMYNESLLGMQGIPGLAAAFDLAAKATPGAMPADVEALGTGVLGVDINVEPGQGPAGSPGSDPTSGSGTDSGFSDGTSTGTGDFGGFGGWARGGYVPGGSGGMDDDVPAIIDGRGPARLSSGEFVFDAATVAALGDGNNTAGAKKLDGLRKAIRKKAYGHEKQPPKNYSVGDLVRLYDKGR